MSKNYPTSKGRLAANYRGILREQKKRKIALENKLIQCDLMIKQIETRLKKYE